MADNENIVVLTDEEGNDTEFELIDVVEYEGDSYVVLLPVSENEEEENYEVVILKCIPDDEDEDNDIYVPVEEDDVLEAVFEIFQNRFEDEEE